MNSTSIPKKKSDEEQECLKRHLTWCIKKNQKTPKNQEYWNPVVCEPTFLLT